MNSEYSKSAMDVILIMGTNKLARLDHATLVLGVKRANHDWFKIDSVSGKQTIR